METDGGRTATSLETSFFHRPFEFDFYQAVKILEALKPGCAEFGVTDDPLKEAFHIRSRVSFSPASSDIQSIRAAAAHTHKPPTLSVNFFGLAGIQGPLPTPFAELIVQQERAKDTALRDFLDIFNHRLLSLWYRIRLKMVVGLDQRPLKKTATGKIFYDLCGLGSTAVQEKLTIPDEQLVHFSPLLWQRPRSLVGLVQILKSYFKTVLKSAQLTIEPHVGRWVKAPLTEVTTLGATGQFNRLGHTFIVGRRAWVQNYNFKICLSGLSLKDYEYFLPNAPYFNHLRDLVYLYVGIDGHPLLSLSLNRSCRPPACLGAKMALGQTAWLGKGGANENEGEHNNFSPAPLIFTIPLK